MTELLDLHDDVLIHLLHFVDLITVSQLMKCCKRLHIIAFNSFKPESREEGIFKFLLNHIHIAIEMKHSSKSVYNEIRCAHILKTFKDIILLLKHGIYIAELTELFTNYGKYIQSVPKEIMGLLLKADFLRVEDNWLIFNCTKNTSVYLKITSNVKYNSYWSGINDRKPVTLVLSRPLKDSDASCYEINEVTISDFACECSRNNCWKCAKKDRMIHNLAEVCNELNQLFDRDENINITPAIIYALSKMNFDEDMNFKDNELNTVIKWSYGHLNVTPKEMYAKISKLKHEFSLISNQFLAVEQYIKIYCSLTPLKRQIQFMEGVMKCMQPISRSYTSLYLTDVYRTRYLHFALQLWMRVDVTSIKVDVEKIRGSVILNYTTSKKLLLRYDKMTTATVNICFVDKARKQYKTMVSSRVLVDLYIKRRPRERRETFNDINDLFLEFFFEHLSF